MASSLSADFSRCNSAPPSAPSPLCPDSDQIPQRNEMTRCANRRHLAATSLGRFVGVERAVELAILQSSGVMLLLAFELVTKGNCFKLDPDGVHDRNHWPRFEYKGRQH
jgi:hypothetical protein